MNTEELGKALPKVVSGQVPGPKSKALLDRRDAAIPQALCGKTYPICIKQGSGAMFEDLDGNIFLDWVGGVGVLNIGYTRPEVVQAVQQQAEKFNHTIFNVIVHDGYVTMAEKLNETIPCRGDVKKTYFANSGAECDENAIKIAKAYTGRSSVICFSGAFHGRTNLTMALTAKKSYALGMGPFPAGIYRAPYPYLYRAPKGYTEEEAIQGLHEAVADFFHEYSRKAVENLSDHVYHFTNHIVECETEGYKTSFRVDYVPDHLPAEERRKKQKEQKGENL